MTTVFEKLRKEAHAFAVASDEVVGRKDIVYRDKFNELIVKECIKVCRSRVGNSDYNTGRMHCASDLKDHFGVAE
jgi:hypothetical protein